MDLIERVDSINVYKRGSNRAPHKPLYLLFLLSAVQRGHGRFLSFAEVDSCVGKALRLFGPRTATVHPEYPFWWLQQDNLSEVIPSSVAAYDLRKGRSDPKKTSLLKVGAQGGLLAGDYAVLSKNPELVVLLCHRILDNHFPISLHEDILDFFGLEVSRISRNASFDFMPFRMEVLSGYGFTCAVSGFRGSGEVGFAGIEPAEILWRNHGGEATVANGIAMTTTHRKLFQLGLFTLGQDYRIKLSPFLGDGSPIGLVDGKCITLPGEVSKKPSAKALEWHRRWVFRG